MRNSRSFFFLAIIYHNIITSQNEKPPSSKMAKYIQVTVLKCKYVFDEIESLSLLSKITAHKFYKFIFKITVFD